MATANNAPFVVFNGGEIGAETLSRVTLDNYAACAEVMENVWCEANGPMRLRPGWGYQATLGTPKVRLQRFVRSQTEKFILALSSEELRIVALSSDPADVIARPAVTAAITNGGFATDITGWTDISDVGTSVGVSSGRLLLNADGTNTAGVRQEVTVNESGTLHAIEIDVHHGPVRLKVGSAAGGSDYIAERELRTGFHSLAVTPSGASFWIDITSRLYRQIEVESIAIAAAGDLVIATPWTIDDLQSLRFEQTLNVMYVFGVGSRHKRIERWDNNSWALTDTDETNGPFMDQNADQSVTITPSVRVGNGTLTANMPLFTEQNVGSLWRLIQSGQFQSRVVDGEDQWTEPVLVQGVGGARAVTCQVVTSDLEATVRFQQSVGNTTSWVDAALGSTGSGNVKSVIASASDAFAFNDGLDNNRVYYRAGIKAGEYTSGSATVEISFASSSTEGIVRVTNYTDAENVSMEVLSTLARSSATEIWAEGAWSDRRGWPRAAAVFDGRLWTLRDDKFWGSYSDSYESHLIDDGRSSAIARSIGFGDSNTGQWMIGLSRLVIGADGAEDVVRSSAFDEPLSTTNMTVREMSTYGAGDVQPIKVDTRALYLDASGFHLMEMAYDVKVQDYVARPLTQLHRDVGRPGITQLSVMRRPDTRALAVRADGQLLTKLFDPGENVMGWARWTTPGAAGVIESVCVIPKAAENQDDIFASVARTVGGVTYRYLEKLGPLHYTSKTAVRNLDSHVVYSGSATRTLSAPHLKGETVMVWADGYNAGEYVVDATTGNVTLPDDVAAVENAVVGLYYRGRYKGPMLAFGARSGTAMAQRAEPNKISIKVRNTVLGGISYGRDDDNGRFMDQCDDRTNDDPHDSGPAMVTGWTDILPMPGETCVDPRVCIEMAAPMPAIIDGFVVGELMTERVS